MKFKKLVSGLLAGALAVTSVFTGNVPVVKAEGNSMPSPAVVTGDVAVPSPMLQFTFDEDVSTDAKGKAKATKDGGTADAVEDAERAGKVLSLSNSGYLKVTNKDNENNPLIGKKALTISYWSKCGNSKGWAYFIKSAGGEISYGSAQNYVAVMDQGASITAQRFWGGADAGRANGEAAALNLSTAEKWKQVTVVLAETSTTVYVNGEKKVVKEGQNKTGNDAGAHQLSDYLIDGSIFQIGRANWSATGEFFEGKIDDFTVYEGVLTDEQVKAAYDQCFGQVKVKMVCGQEVLREDTIENYLMTSTGACKPYALKEEDKSISKNGKVYIREDNQTNLTPSAENPTVTVSYREVAVTEVLEKTFTCTTRVGVEPDLPKTAPVKFEGNIEGTAPIEWTIAPGDYAAVTTEPKVIKGKVSNIEVTLSLTVKDKEDFVIADYSFDNGGDGLADGVPGSEKYGAKEGTAKDKIEVKAGLMGNALYLPGGSKGAAYVTLPDDILKVGESNAKNITASMFVKSDTEGWAWPMALLSKSANNSGTDYIALINRGDDVKGYRAEYRYNNGTQFPAAYSESDNREQWNHFAIVVDSDRHKMSLYRNGKLSGEAENADIDISKLTGGENYLGHSPFGDQDFKGAIDEFKIYNATLSEKEIKSICDDTLYTAQMEATLKGLETLETWDGLEADLDNVEDDLKLPAKGKGDSAVITWESTNQEVINTVTPGDGIVTQPYGEGAEDAEVTLTATVKIRDYEKTEQVTYNVIVPKREGVDKKPLRHAISDARDEYEAARKKSTIYVASSFEKLKNAFEDAQAALDQADLTEAQVAEKIKTLNEARKLQLKNLDQLAGLLTAWYPLDKDAKDSSGNGADGTAATSVTYSRDNGATLNGGAALKNMITLPVDKLNITDQMTFSFRVNAKQKRNLFGIGTVVGNDGGQSKQFFITSAFNALVTDRGWAGGASKGYENLKFDLNKWHDVTVVLDGMTITLYLDGVKMETKNTETTLPDAWNYAEGTKFAYIGNCAYAHNGTGSLDPDFDGSIKDFRIYNAALADEQIASITAYRDALPMAYAKSDLAAAMKALGATENADGTYALDIIQTSVNDQGVLALPAKVNEEKTAVKWEAEGDGADAIDLTTNKVTIPAAGTVKEFTLKATIEAAGKTETLTCICRAYSENTSLDKTALKDLIAELRAYKPENYTKTSYDALQAAVDEAYDAIPTLANKDDVDAQIAKLNDAKKALVDLSGLRSAIEELEAELVGMDEENYTEASWKALKDEIAKAKTLLEKENASKTEVSTQIAALITKRGGLKSCGEKEVLEKAIKAAEELEKYKDSYNNWASLETALATAKGKLEERLEDYAPAAEALNTAVSNLVVKDGHKLEGTEKTQLQTKLEEAKAEKQNLTKEDFVESSWTAYEEALEALEAVLAKDNAIKAEAQDAAAAVAEARAALVPLSSEKAGSAEKTTLESAIAGVNTASGDYTPESWAEYQSAKAVLDQLLARMNEEKHNVTKGEISKAITGLDTAAANLVPNAEQALTEEDKAAVANTIADAKALNLTNYTPESRTAYRDALKALETLSKRSSTTKNEIKKATEALEEARAALVPTEAQKVTPEKKTEFTTAYTAETGKNLKAADYTAESWARYEAALKAAEEISVRLSKEGNNVTKAEIDAVITELKAAAEALTRNAPVTNKTALNTAIKAAEKLKEKTYTKATWDKFKASLNAAKAVYANANATQKQINDATNDLKAKQNALKLAATKIAITDKTTGSKPAKIVAGKKVTLTAKATAPKGAGSSVTWKVDNTSKKKKYASINSKGVLNISKKAAGKKITVTATSKDGRGAKATVKITVMKNAVTKITLKAGKKKVKAGKSITVKATVKTNGKKANKTLVWSVDKKSAKYASINKKGKLTTKKAGKNKTVTVTAMATDGTKKKATIKIKLTK